MLTPEQCAEIKARWAAATPREEPCGIGLTGPCSPPEIPCWPPEESAGASRDPFIRWCATQPNHGVAWTACRRGDWMLRAAAQVSGPSGSVSRRRVVAAGVECALLLAETAPTHERDWILRCVRLCGSYADGKTTIWQLTGERFPAHSTAANAADHLRRLCEEDGYGNAKAAWAAQLILGQDGVSAQVLAAASDVVRRHFPTWPSSQATDVAALLATVEALRSELAKAVRVIRDVEWVWMESGGGEKRECPDCAANEYNTKGKHEDGCELSAFLARHGGA